MKHQQMKASKQYKPALLFIALLAFIVVAFFAAGCSSTRKVNAVKIKTDSTGESKQTVTALSVSDSIAKTSKTSKSKGSLIFDFAAIKPGDTTSPGKPAAIAQISSDGTITILSAQPLIKATIEGEMVHKEADSTGLHKEAANKAENSQKTQLQKSQQSKQTDSDKKTPTALIIGGCIVALLLGLFFILRTTK